MVLSILNNNTLNIQDITGFSYKIQIINFLSGTNSTITYHIFSIKNF